MKLSFAARKLSKPYFILYFFYSVGEGEGEVVRGTYAHKCDACASVYSL